MLRSRRGIGSQLGSHETEGAVRLLSEVSACVPLALRRVRVSGRTRRSLCERLELGPSPGQPAFAVAPLPVEAQALPRKLGFPVPNPPPNQSCFAPFLPQGNAVSHSRDALDRPLTESRKGARRRVSTTPRAPGVLGRVGFCRTRNGRGGSAHRGPGRPWGYPRAETGGAMHQLNLH